MTLQEAINETREQLMDRREDINLYQLDKKIDDPKMLGDWLIGAACAENFYQYNASDYLWYNIAAITSYVDFPDNTLRVGVKYYCDDAEEAQAAAAADALASTLNLGSLTVPNAINALYLWIAKNVTYDNTSRIGGGYQRNSMYDVLVVKKAVCQGVANTVYYMINKYLDAGCRMVQGHELYYRRLYKHCFNLVHYNNVWYYLDATAAIHAFEDDPSISDADLLAWCMKSGADMQASGRTNYLALPNHLRSYWREKIQPIATSSL